MSSQAIGIDLGGVNSCVSVFRNGKIEIIPNEFGGKKTPCYVAFRDEEILIGETAKNQLKNNPKNTIFYLERLIGRKYEEIKRQEIMKNCPFKIIKDEVSDKPKIQITCNNEVKKYYPENILSMILKKLKQNASDYLGNEVLDAVITVPADFNTYQIQEIEEAAKNADIKFFRILRSSTAVGLAYNFEKNLDKERNALIFDLGSLSLNISVISCEEAYVEVKSINGELNLGGEDFNFRLFEYCSKEFKRKTGIDISNNFKAVNRLFKACEEAKITLSSSTEATIDLEYLIEDKDFNIKITRKEFEELCNDLFKKLFIPIENALKDAKMSKSEIDDIILVGSSSRIPKIQEMIQEFFNGKELNKGLNPEEAIASGAALKAATQRNCKNEKIEKLFLLDVCRFSVGIETVGG